MDITYLRTGEGWLYLYTVRDGCSPLVIGWAAGSFWATPKVGFYQRDSWS